MSTSKGGVGESSGGSSSRENFGGASDVASAIPGSYGLAPSGFRLPEATRLGPVRLQVAELERSVAFYRDVLGLELLE
ncbi:MAG: VOC family protein, partial [Thermoanaerobaculia bacterium]